MVAKVAEAQSLRVNHHNGLRFVWGIISHCAFLPVWELAVCGSWVSNTFPSVVQQVPLLWLNLKVNTLYISPAFHSWFDGGFVETDLAM